jgi:hypothetical protein
MFARPVINTNSEVQFSLWIRMPDPPAAVLGIETFSVHGYILLQIHSRVLLYDANVVAVVVAQVIFQQSWLFQHRFLLG